MRAVWDNVNVVHLPALEIAGGDPVTWLLNYGALGIVLTLLVLGKLRTKAEVDGLTVALKQSQEETKAARAELTALMTQITTHTVPQLGYLAQVVENLPTTQADAALANRLAALEKELARVQERS